MLTVCFCAGKSLSFHLRQFTSSDDDLIRAVCRRELALSKAAKQMGCSMNTVRRRVTELGLHLPSYFRDKSKMGRPAGSFSGDAIEPSAPLTVYDDTGSDCYLEKLRSVHVFPRDDVYPGSETVARFNPARLRLAV